MIHLTLPWPPSVNRYWRMFVIGKRPRMIISADGRAYRAEVQAIILANRQSIGNKRIAVQIDAHPPDKRVRDLDNMLKAPMDAMQHAGVYDDDSQVDMLTIRRCLIVKGGEIKVAIWEMPEVPHVAD